MNRVIKRIIKKHLDFPRASGDEPYKHSVVDQAQ